MLEESLDVFHQGLLTVGLGEGDLEEEVTADEGAESGQGLFTRTTDTDDEGVSSGGVDDTGQTQEMEQCVVENDEVLFLTGVLLVVGVETALDTLLDGNDTGAGLIDVWGF